MIIVQLQGDLHPEPRSRDSLDPAGGYASHLQYGSASGEGGGEGVEFGGRILNNGQPTSNIPYCKILNGVRTKFALSAETSSLCNVLTKIANGPY